MTTFETLKERYDKGRISETMLRIYVRKGVITEAELNEILYSNDEASANS